VKRYNSGFTLVEVMVALAIFALTAGAISVANIQVASSARQIKDQTQGRWVNQNVLTQLRLSKDLPKPGQKVVEYKYNDLDWTVKIDVNSVEMELLGPFLRNIELKAYKGEDERPVDILSAVLGEPGK